jgi:hypothetical protein
MFANSTSSYAEKIMSLMKRGSLVCLLFFLLAIISQAGQNAERIAKAFGGLVVVAILLTTPITTVVTDIDNVIKNTWQPSGETANDQTKAGSDAATANTTAESDAVQIANNLGLPGSLAALLPQSILGKIGTGASAVGNFLRGFLP